MKHPKPRGKVVSSSNARYNLPELLNIIRDGEGPVTITNRGKVKAVIISPEEYAAYKKSKKISKSSLAGIWSDRPDMKDSAKWVNKLRENEENRSK